MTDKTLKLGYSWADECDSDEELPVSNFSEVNIECVNDIAKDINEKFIEKQKEITEEIKIIENSWSDEKIIDKPENLNTLYVKRENEYKRQQQNTLNNTWKKTDKNNWIEVQNNKKKNSKCYTCYPRKKVSEHIIQRDKYATFHHDMCNRNIIVITPNKHYSNFENISENIIGILFKSVHKFCKDWNIEDYSVSYNQGEWQTHSHFHLKLKTHDNIIKRLRGDHWRRQKIFNERNLSLNN